MVVDYVNYVDYVCDAGMTRLIMWVDLVFCTCVLVRPLDRLSLMPADHGVDLRKRPVWHRRGPRIVWPIPEYGFTTCRLSWGRAHGRHGLPGGTQTPPRVINAPPAGPSQLVRTCAAFCVS